MSNILDGKEARKGVSATPLQASCAALCGALCLPLVLSLLVCYLLSWRRETPCLDLLYKILSSSPKNCVGCCFRQLAGGHAATVSTMEIETDGDCDSAFVTTLGREYFMGANGYEVD